MYKALDNINYKRIQLNKDKPIVNKSTTTINHPKSLLETCAVAVNNEPVLCEYAIVNVPVHLAPLLLRIAIENVQSQAVSVLISNWPLASLCFRDILYDTDCDIFGEQMGFDLVVFKGVTARTDACKLTCLDLRGFKLNQIFTHLIIQMWPILSLKKWYQKPKKLAKLVADAAGVDTCRLTEETLPRILQDLLHHEMVKHPYFQIKIPKGKKMVVKIDSVQFSTNNTFFMDYLVCNCLRKITPIYVQVSNIIIRSDLQIGDEITDSLAPFIVFRGHETETLEGISLKRLEEGIFYMVSSDLKKFTNIRSLDLQDCNIYLQAGKTRSRTSGRMQMISTLSVFSHLVRLDISYNYILGCFGEILDALQCPLEYLNIRGCDLSDEDIGKLASSKHAESLKELNISRLCQFSMFDYSRTTPSFLIKVLKHFKNLVILNIGQNRIPDSCVAEFCDILKKHLTSLKGCDLAGNVLMADNQIEIVKTCAQLKCAQWLRLTCVNSMLDHVLGPLQNGNGMAEMQDRVKALLQNVGRTDIVVDIVKLSYSIFVDFLDNLEA